MKNIEISVPASTSNLGASFDTCGVALSLYLNLKVEPSTKGFQIVGGGECANIPTDESNLIVCVARYVAEQRGNKLEGARIKIDSDIPLSRGLGSSSSAVIAGISLYEALTSDNLSESMFFEYALHFEGHGDNLAPSYLGGAVVAVVKDHVDAKGEERRGLITIKRPWPEEIKTVICIPDYEMETKRMREVLPSKIDRSDAIFNLQRAALLQAALASNRFDLIGEALRDKLHQPYRAPLATGMTDVLRLNDEVDEYPGLLGVAISGAGSTMIAFALENTKLIAEAMSMRFASHGVKTRTMDVNVDNQGRKKIIF